MLLLSLAHLAVAGTCGTAAEIRANYERTHAEPHDDRVFGDDREAWRILRMASEGSAFLAGKEWAFAWLELKYGALANDVTPTRMTANMQTWRERHTWRVEIGNLGPPASWVAEAQARLGCDGPVARSTTTYFMSPGFEDTMRAWGEAMSNPNREARREALFEYCTAGDALSCKEAVLLSTEADPRIDAAALQACEKDRYYCAPVGRHLLERNVFRSTAKRVARKGCDAGVAAACTLAGDLVQSDDREAAFLAYDKACQVNDPLGCVGKANMMLRGVNGRNEPTHAGEQKAAVRAACQLHPKGCTVMADLALQGRLWPSDLGEARRVAALGCAERNPAGCTRVAEMWVKMETIAAAVPKEEAERYQDLDQGLSWARRGCALGSRSSCELARVVESVLRR